MRTTGWAVDATFVVPPDDLSPTTKDEVGKATERYAAAKIEATDVDVRAARIRGRRALPQVPQRCWSSSQWLA